MRPALLALALVVTASSAHAIDCEKYMKLHGFLSRAQFQCGFSRYANDIMAQAKECSGFMGEARQMESIKSGMMLFDARETERGHDAMCASVLKSFPKAVAR